MIEVFAAKSRLSCEVVEGVLAGEPITEDIAIGLYRGTMISAGFWMNLERNYRQGLAKGHSE